MKDLNESIEKILGESKSETPITLQTFITTSTLTSKRIVSELEYLEANIIKLAQTNKINKLIVLNVKLELVLEEIKKIKYDYFLKK